MRILPFLLLLASWSPAQQRPAGPVAPPGGPGAAPAAPTPPPVQEVAIRQNSAGETILMPRIRNVTRLHNSMPHQLIGIGVVTGLPKTGSSDRGTRQAILNVVRQLGINLTMADVVGGSTALVSLSCSLPPFGKQGQL
ncbi:MAG: flagellar basal body P-ring protein FlgI, partial [Planctomycetota bacterium]